MRIIGVDPSTTVTGVAVVDGTMERPILVAGELLKPSAALPYTERVVLMMRDLQDILGEYRPDRAVIEMPEGKRHRRMGRTNMASLAVYGVAAGALLAVLTIAGLPTHPGLVNEASRQLSKRQRQHRARAWFTNYDPEKDKGFDLSDAIFLAVEELERS